jgi:hypothetical protein
VPETVGYLLDVQVFSLHPCHSASLSRPTEGDVTDAVSYFLEVGYINAMTNSESIAVTDADQKPQPVKYT